MDITVEDTIRRLSIKQLEALAVFIPTGEKTGEYISVEKVFNSIHTAENDNKVKAVGGVISSLAKIKTKNGPLILPAGKSEQEGMRWVLNKKVITREELREILSQIPNLDI